MTAAISILKYYREHQKAIREELAGDEFQVLRTHLDIFATYWRGAQHLLRKPESEFQPLELLEVRMAAYDVLKEMAVCANSIPPDSATAGLYQLEDTDVAQARRDFGDRFIKEWLTEWYWGFRTTLKPGHSFSYEWVGAGVERMLSLKFFRGDAETLHTLYFTLPEGAATLGERVAAFVILVNEVMKKMSTLALSPDNWPTDTEVEVASKDSARRIADAMYRRLTPAQLSQLRNQEEVILAAFHAALKRY